MAALFRRTFLQSRLAHIRPAPVRPSACTAPAPLRAPSRSKSTKPEKATNRAPAKDLDLRKKKGSTQKDKRNRLIQYALSHPILPRPLKFGRLRALRHWTIMRAWKLHQRNTREATKVELERQWNSMREAGEALRLHEPDGRGDGGRLYRIAMEGESLGSKIIWPREMRIMVDTPRTGGWNHDWKKD